MKTELKKIDSTKREMSVEVSGEVVKNKFEDVFKRIQEKAKFPGFRPGHVPQDILEKHFSSQAHQQVINELIPDIYQQITQKEGIEVIDVPKIQDIKLDRTTLSFKAQFEVAPDVPLKYYKGLKITYSPIAVTADEIKRSIDSLKESRKVDAVTEAFARGLGYPHVAELEKAIERQLALQKENSQRQKIETQIIEYLDKELDFKLPKMLVDRQHNDLIRRTKIELAMRGLTNEQIEEQEKTWGQTLEAEARHQVKVYLILSAIAKKEKIPQDENMSARVMEFLLREADWQLG